MPDSVRSIVKSWYHRGLEAGDRLALRFRRALGGGARMRVAAAVAGRFPVYFHTFAYQELLALHDGLGAEVRVFHLLKGDRGTLDGAFGYLLRHRVKLPNAREVSAADLEHYRRVAPDRVARLLEALAAESGLPAEEVAGHPAVQRAFTFARKVELYRPDWIHTYFFYEESLWGLVAQWLLGVPRGITAYADHVLRDWPLKVVPLHLRTADLVVATSRRAERELRDLAGAELAPRILVKPNGVDGRRFPPGAAVRRDPAVLELISVSRLEPKKGLLELADVARACADRGLPVRIHVVGDADPGRPESAEYAARLRQRIDALDVAATFVLHGRRTQEDLLPLLQRADAFVAPYVETESGDKDGIPTAVLEAMSCGLAILATDAGSMPEVVDDRVEGRVVPAGDPARMVDAISELASDRALAAAMGRRARARFEREFDVAVTERPLHDRIRALVERGRG